MVKVINPIYGQSPLAGTISNLGKSLFSPLSSAESLQRETARKAQRENIETEALAQLVQDKGGVQGLGADPVAQALQIVSGYDPNKFGRLGAIGAATSGGVNDPNASEWLVGMGEGASSPWNLNANRAQQESQFGRSLAETMRQFDQKPMPALVEGQPGFVMQRDLVGDAISPIISETEQKGTLLGNEWDNLAELDPQQQNVLGAAGSGVGTVRNYITPKGTFLVTDESAAQGKDLDGNPLPPGGYIGTVQGSATETGANTNSVQTDLQSDVVATRKFKTLVGMARPLTDNPELFGLPGMIRSKAQDVLQSVGGVAQAIGQSEQEFIDQGLRPLEPESLKRLVPELYDPRLSEVETLWGLLVYQGAMALAGQQGRSVSDADVLQMRNILGDPHSFFASNLSMRSKLDIAERVVDAYSTVTQDALARGVQSGPATPPPPTPGAGAAIYDRASPTPPPGFAAGEDEAVRRLAWEKYRGG